MKEPTTLVLLETISQVVMVRICSQRPPGSTEWSSPLGSSGGDDGVASWLITEAFQK